MFTVVGRFSCYDSIDAVEWSHDSQYVLCAQYKRATVQVFSIHRKEWTCRIMEGVAGLVNAFWAPDGRHVLTTADFQVHMTVWSLVDDSKHWTISNPKLSSSHGHSFSHDGNFLAVATRRECKDGIQIYSTQRGDWKQLNRFNVASLDLEEIAWSPQNDAIVVRDSPLEYLFLVYSPSTGELIARHQAYENALGIKSMGWSPCGGFVAFGSYDEMCRIVSHVSWKSVCECDHSVPFTSNKVKVVKVGPLGVAPGIGANETEENEADIANIPNAGTYKPRIVKPDSKKPFPRVGVGAMSWSFDSQFLATRNDNMPFNVWIWSPSQLEPVATLEFTSRVHSFKWSPCLLQLAVTTGESVAYMYDIRFPDVVNVCRAWEPTTAKDATSSFWKHPTLGLRWNNTGDRLLLVSKNAACFSQL